MESFMGDLSACETMIMKVIWDAKEDIALQDLIRELADRYKKNYARTTVVTFVHKIVDKGFATTYRKGKAAYIHPEKSLAAYRDELLQQQLEFWFDGKPSAFLSAWCEKNKLSREEADRIREIIEKEQSWYKGVSSYYKRNEIGCSFLFFSFLTENQKSSCFFGKDHV